MTEPRLLTIKEVGEYLRLSPRTVYDLMKTGDLPFIKLGRRRRVKRSDLEEFLERMKVDVRQN